MHPRSNTLITSPLGAKFKVAVVQFKVKAVVNGGSDKGPDGNRIDSIPIANGIIRAGCACDLIFFDPDNDIAEFKALTWKYDALILRINPGQLSQGTAACTQQQFDELMNYYVTHGKLVLPSPKQSMMLGAKDALVKISHLKCGLKDTFAYYSDVELIEGFKKTMAFQPRVIKQNRGSSGEGVWLCWLWDNARQCKKEVYPSKFFGQVSLSDNDCLMLMEMNDNHVEYHTVKEFVTFCISGPDAENAGKWQSTSNGKYLEGGKLKKGCLIVDQRLLPRIDEGEVRILMVGGTCHMIIHKKPFGEGLSAVQCNAEYTYYKPCDSRFQGLVAKLYAELPSLQTSLDLDKDELLPLLWTCDFIPKNPDTWVLGPYDRSCPEEQTEYTVGEFNCSCVGISKLQALCGGEKTIADVSDEDYFNACQLTDMMGVKVMKMLEEKNSDAVIVKDGKLIRSVSNSTFNSKSV